MKFDLPLRFFHHKLLLIMNHCQVKQADTSLTEENGLLDWLTFCYPCLSLLSDVNELYLFWSLTWPEDYKIQGDYPAKYVWIRDVTGCLRPQEQKGQWHRLTPDMLGRPIPDTFVVKLNQFVFELL